MNATTRITIAAVVATGALLLASRSNTPDTPPTEPAVQVCADAMTTAGKADPDLPECQQLPWEQTDQAAGIYRARL